MSKVIDMRGQRFGMLVVLDEPPLFQDRYAYWHCRCDCGRETLARGTAMRKGEKKSCGCRAGKPYDGQSQRKKKPIAKLWDCQYQLNVQCEDLDCENCGWNPAVAKARSREILASMSRRDL